MLIAAEHVLLPNRPEFVAGWVELTGDAITAVGEGAPPATRRRSPRIAVGNKADLVILDDDAAVTAVMYRGAWQ